jgi:uncharacterized membrane protein YgdD (TMEM256/DUF423 family)
MTPCIYLHWAAPNGGYRNVGVIGKGIGMRRIWLAAVGLGGFAAVAIGAVTDHVISGDARAHLVLGIASQFAMYHSLALLGLIAIESRFEGTAARLVTLAGWLFIGGIVLFSGSLVVLALTPFSAAAFGAPIGGTALMAGWLSLVLAAVGKRRAS